MKIYSILIIISLSLVPKTLIAQNKRVKEKLVSLYLYDGNIFNGLCGDTGKDTITIEDYSLGIVRIPESLIKQIQYFELQQYVKIKLNNSRSLTGRLENISSDTLVIVHANYGRVAIPGNNIFSMNESQQEPAGKWSTDPNCTRYFFAPSSFMLKKGEGYYQNAYILSNSVNYGINDHFTIGGGIILPIIFYVTPKVGYSLSKYIHVGAGIFAGGTYLNKGIGAGIGYGVLSLGTRDYHFTFGAGYGGVYQNNLWKNTEKPIVTLSANARVSRRISLVTENWIFHLPFDKQVEREETVNGVTTVYYESIGTIKKQVAISTLGGRFVWEKLSLDLGILAPINFEEVNFVLPYIDLVVKF